MFYARIVSLALVISAIAAASEAAGTWRGESHCAVQNSACREETVIYLIRDVPDRLETVFIQADKIVDGQRVTMGTSEWQYDRNRHTLKWSTPRQVWLLDISGSRITGTLTLADGTLFRRMELRKD